MNIFFTWKYRKEFLHVDCTVTKDELNTYNTSIKVCEEGKQDEFLYHFDIINLLGKQEYKIYQGIPDAEMLKDISDVILEQIDIIRPCHLN